MAFGGRNRLLSIDKIEITDYGDSAFNIAWPRAAAPLLARARG